MHAVEVVLKSHITTSAATLFSQEINRKYKKEMKVAKRVRRSGIRKVK
jgi:hypothetical protein